MLMTAGNEWRLAFTFVDDRSALSGEEGRDALDPS
jgi:hypothetical protein